MSVYSDYINTNFGPGDSDPPQPPICDGYKNLAWFYRETELFCKKHAPADAKPIVKMTHYDIGDNNIKSLCGKKPAVTDRFFWTNIEDLRAGNARSNPNCQRCHSVAQKNAVRHSPFRDCGTATSAG